MCGNYQNTQPLVTRRKCTKFWQKSPESLCGQNQEWKVFAVNLFLNTKCPLLWTLRILFGLEDWQLEIYFDHPKKVTHPQNYEVRPPRPLLIEFFYRTCDRWTHRVWWQRRKNPQVVGPMLILVVFFASFRHFTLFRAFLG